MNLKRLFSFILISGAILNASQVSAQLKVGTNPGTIGANSNLESEATNGTKTVIQKDNGNVGIGTASPSNALHVKSAENPIKLEGVQDGSGKLLVLSADGTVKTDLIVTPKAVLVVKRGTNWTATTSKIIPWDVETYDPENAFTPGSTSYTIQKSGLHQIFVNASVNGTTFPTGSAWYLRILKNGSAIAASDATKASGASTTVFSVDEFVAGDVITIDFGGAPNTVFQNLTKASIFRFE